MFHGPGSMWSGGHMGGWFMPGFFMLIILALLVWLAFRRQSTTGPAALRCPQCSGEVQATYLRCPHCGTSLKHNCPQCSRIVEGDWAFCPHCGESSKSPTNSG
jgi:RNA polymerase subunit RPABC4/transcription elongation factor Spt4